MLDVIESAELYKKGSLQRKALRDLGIEELIPKSLNLNKSLNFTSEKLDAGRHLS